MRIRVGVNWGIANPRGFTLVELVAVVAILGILASLSVPRFIGVLSSSKEKVCAANVKLIEDAANLYIMHEINPVDLNATNIIETLQNAKYLGKSSFKCPLDDSAYTLNGDKDSGYTVTCPNNCN